MSSSDDTSLRNRVAIVGVGESDISKAPQMRGPRLNPQAARLTLDDAGLEGSDIDGLLTAYSFSEPYFMFGTVLCEYLGLKPRYCSALVAGSASPAVMLEHAAAAIAVGLGNRMLVCTCENQASVLNRDDGGHASIRGHRLGSEAGAR